MDAMRAVFLHLTTPFVEAFGKELMTTFIRAYVKTAARDAALDGDTIS